jgi:hypothetical protein
MDFKSVCMSAPQKNCCMFYALLVPAVMIKGKQGCDREGFEKGLYVKGLEREG